MAGCPSSHQPTRIREETLESGGPLQRKLNFRLRTIRDILNPPKLQNLNTKNKQKNNENLILEIKFRVYLFSHKFSHKSYTDRIHRFAASEVPNIDSNILGTSKNPIQGHLGHFSLGHGACSAAGIKIMSIILTEETVTKVVDFHRFILSRKAWRHSVDSSGKYLS